MGDPDKADLQAALERAGWSARRHAGDAWWEHEVWELVSAWRPVAAKAFLTFLIDPQAGTSGISAVWAIAVSRERVADAMGRGGTTITVSPRWPERMKEIVDATGALRPAS